MSLGSGAWNRTTIQGFKGRETADDAQQTAGNKPFPSEAEAGLGGALPLHVQCSADSVALNATDPEAALAFALSEATKAGEWSVVATLAEELRARRIASAGAVDLQSERRKRSKG